MGGSPVDLGGSVARNPGYDGLPTSLGGSAVVNRPKTWAMAIYSSDSPEKWFPPLFEFRLEPNVDNPSVNQLSST
ncbi:hypothetical protein BHE74_00037615 [Ensete ventricosum]|nr:hypothetical protein GW17_00043275 [Ensete ventricosum]RWW55717.1 hypothetical protein BHE74_00037615 [Ensete ventricosum]RZS25945.1 hypothetical protein BHM03_00059228 [Ensete ventricosum]